MPISPGEDMLELDLVEQGLPAHERNYKFCPTRKWQADFCWPAQQLIVEVEGGNWANGRHVRPTGFVKDIEKYNKMTLMGFALLRFTTDQVKDGTAVTTIMEWFEIQNGLDPLP